MGPDRAKMSTCFFPVQSRSGSDGSLLFLLCLLRKKRPRFVARPKPVKCSESCPADLPEPH